MKSEAVAWPTYIDKKRIDPDAINDPQDLFIEQNGLCYAGTHLILDVWNANYLDDLERIETALRDCVQIAGATLLHLHLHHFTPNMVFPVLRCLPNHISVFIPGQSVIMRRWIFLCVVIRSPKNVSKYFERRLKRIR